MVPNLFWLVALTNFLATPETFLFLELVFDRDLLQLQKSTQSDILFSFVTCTVS